MKILLRRLIRSRLNLQMCVRIYLMSKFTRLYPSPFEPLSSILRYQGGPPRGGPFPFSPEINWLAPLFPKYRNFVSHVPCYNVPNVIFLLLFPSKFGLCSTEINVLFPLFPKTLGGPRLACAYGEDSNQSGHPRSLASLSFPPEESLDH